MKRIKSFEQDTLLYVISTPIGNLKEFSPRAIECIKECDFIASEDTRTTSLLLSKFNISKPSISYHEHNEQAHRHKRFAYPRYSGFEGKTGRSQGRCSSQPQNKHRNAGEEPCQDETCHYSSDCTGKTRGEGQGKDQGCRNGKCKSQLYPQY